MQPTEPYGEPASPGSHRVRLLIVDDSKDDAALIVDALESAGFDAEHRVVDNADELVGALVSGTWDAVISDYSMPRFNGREALTLVRAANPDPPFIVVSGVINDEQAVATMRAGAPSSGCSIGPAAAHDGRPTVEPAPARGSGDPRSA